MKKKDSLLLFAKNYWENCLSKQNDSSIFLENTKYDIIDLDSKYYIICGNFINKNSDCFFSLFLKYINENQINIIKKFNTFDFCLDKIISNEKMNQLILNNYSNNNDIVFLYDSEENKIYFHKNIMETILNFSNFKSENTFCLLINNIHKKHKKYIAKLLLNLNKINIFELEIKNSANYYTWYNLTSFPLYVNNDAPTKYIFHLKNISKRKSLENLLLSQAKRDSLTNLLNRTEIEKEINNLITQNLKGTLIMLDIDNFKLINDIKGHLYGDYFLKTIANLISKTFKRSITSRIGGDEFIIYLKNTNLENNIKQINLLKNELKTIFPDDFKELHINVSYGISTFPCDGKNFSDLYFKADKEMYANKKNSKFKKKPEIS